MPDSPYTEYRALGKTTVSGEGTQLVLAPGVSEQDVRVALYHVRDACMAIVWYSFRLYQPQDHQALSIRHTEVRRGAGGAVPQPAQLHPVERLMHDHEGDVLVMLTLLVDFIGYNIGRLSHLDEINTSAHNLINQAYVELSKQVNDTEVATFVRTPRIFKQHLFFVMAVFLLVWTPFSMWLTLSWGVTVVFYPILIYLLAGAHACARSASLLTFPLSRAFHLSLLRRRELRPRQPRRSHGPLGAAARGRQLDPQPL